LAGKGEVMKAISERDQYMRADGGRPGLSDKGRNLWGRVIVGFLVVSWVLICGAARPALAASTLDAQLCDAATSGKSETIAGLVKKGASLNAACTVTECAFAGCKTPPTSTGVPLYFAVLKDRADAVKALLAVGADANAADPKYGDTPVFWLRSAAVADLLFAHGGNAAIRDKNGDTALTYLDGRIGSTIHGLTAVQAGAVARILVAHGADINATSKDGDTVLMIAVVGGYTEFVRALIDLGIGVIARTSQGKTALGLAKQQEQLAILAPPATYRQIAALLLAHGAKE
jgi:ankyrin repeat protein